MAHFYLIDDLADPKPGDTVSLTGAEARHASTVSRIREGERLTVGDGAGLILMGEVVGAAHDRVEIRVDTIDRTDVPSPTIFLAQALAKGGRDESAVQSATELGIDGIIPWAAQRSIVKWEGAKVRKGAERWEAIVREATKQSIRPRLPEIAPLITTPQLARLAPATRVLVLVPGADVAIADIRDDGRDIVLVVGPEGGIAPTEIERLTDAGAETVRLGSGILRTSTAGPAALAVLNVALGRW